MPSNFNNQGLTEIKFNGVDVSEAYFNNVLVFDSRFISTWRTTTANETITLPTPTNYEVDWGDGTSTTNANSHVYSIGGDYEIKIRGDINDFIFNNGGDKDKIISIENAGGLILTGDSLNGCSNLEYLKGKLKKPKASLGDCFKRCSVFNSDLLSLDTSDVTALTSTFREATLFNGDISNWNTSNAISIGSLFYQASSFDGDLSLWDVSKVTNMSSAFFSASSFSGDLSSWITTSLINCASVFLNAILFNSDIGSWDVSNVTQMQNMLRSTSFNYPLNLWDTSSVVNMQLMFAGTTSFNQRLDSWSFVSVTNINGFMTSKTDTDYNSNYLSDLLIKLDQDLVFANMVNVNLGFGTIKYDSTGVTAYNSLVAKGFIIQSGGQV